MIQNYIDTHNLFAAVDYPDISMTAGDSSHIHILGPMVCPCVCFLLSFGLVLMFNTGQYYRALSKSLTSFCCCSNL